MTTTRGRWRLRFETVGSIAAIIVGGAALFISADEARNARETRFAASLPIVQAGISSGTNGEIIQVFFFLENAGIGPAMIHSVTPLVRGEPQLGLGAFADQVLPEELDLADANFVVDAGELTTLNAGERMESLIVRWRRTPEREPASEAVFDQLIRGELAMQVCYCDVYDRCWETVPDDFAEPVDHCPAPTGFPRDFLARR